MNIGGLFDGIGGFSLGLLRAGFLPTWHSEIDAHCCAVLEARFPYAPNLGDVTKIDLDAIPKVQGITAGFPCQDLSRAGLGKGIGGSKSGLWTEAAKVIEVVQPEFVVLENVPGLLYRGFELVLANLVELGYNVEWDCLPAEFVGLPHFRDRAWVVAHRWPEPVVFGPTAHLFPMRPADAVELVGGVEDADTPHEAGWLRWPRSGWVSGDASEVMPLQPHSKGTPTTAMVPTPTRQDGYNHGAPSQHLRRSLPLNAWAQVRRWPTPRASGGWERSRGGGEMSTYSRTPSQQAGKRGLYLQAELNEAEAEAGRPSGLPMNPEWVEWLMGYPMGWTAPWVALEDVVRFDRWDVEPDVPRLLSKEKAREVRFVQRVGALGNSLVPQIPYWIGERLRARMEELSVPGARISRLQS